MKKILYISLVLLISVAALCGCAKKVDYNDYISEKRTDIYLYSSEGLEIKIYVSEKETPYLADGIKGEVTPLSEIFVTLPKNSEEVEVKAGGVEGEMSYRAVENRYYLSATGGNISGDKVEVTLTFDGESNVYSAVSVKYDGVMSCEDAVKCVAEHAPELFSSLTENNIFKGEIYVRILYDEGCYYYVGVCDREKKIEAFLVDGVRGKIIATKQLNG